MLGDLPPHFTSFLLWMTCRRLRGPSGMSPHTAGGGGPGQVMCPRCSSALTLSTPLPPHPGKGCHKPRPQTISGREEGPFSYLYAWALGLHHTGVDRIAYCRPLGVTLISDAQTA